jgi:hypothetical protein
MKGGQAEGKWYKSKRRKGGERTGEDRYEDVRRGQMCR